MSEDHKVNINQFWVVTAKVSKNLTIQRDQNFLFKTKGSTFAAEQNDNLISPIPHFEIFNTGKLSLILPLDPHWGPNPCS